MNPPLDPSILQKVSDLYGFRVVLWNATLGGLSSRNDQLIIDGNLAVLKQYRLKSGELDRIESLASFLKEHSIPVSHPLKNKNGKRHFLYEETLFALFPWIEGGVLHEPLLQPTHLQRAALLLATFHTLKPNPLPTHPLLTQKELEPSKNKVLSLVQASSLGEEIDSLVSRWIDSKWSFLRLLLKREEIPLFSEAGHLVHGDFYNENILFDASGKVAGVLDLERSHFGHRIEDVVHFILLSCCNSGFEEKNLQKAHLFFQTYQRKFPLSREEIALGIPYALCQEFSSFFLEERLYETKNLFFVELIQRDWRKLEYLRKHIDSFIQLLSSKAKTKNK